MKKIMMIALMMMMAIACETEVDTPTPVRKVEEIKAGVLDGTISGVSWTFQSGRVKKSGFDNDLYTYNFWEENVEDPCNETWHDADRSILGMFPAEVQDVTLSSNNNMTIFYKDEGSQGNLIVTQGRFIVSEIMDGTVRGKMLLDFDGETKLSGEFELPLCE